VLVATPRKTLLEQVTQVLARALTNLLPGDNSWAAQKRRTWDPDAGAVETVPLTPKGKSSLKPTPKTATPLHPGFPRTGQFPTKEEYQTASSEAAARNAENRATAQRIRDAEINRTKPTSYRDAAQRPATTQGSLQQQLIQEIARRQALTANHEQRLKRLEADVKLLRQALTPSRSAPLESVIEPVKDIKPLINQTRTPVPNLGNHPSGGASGSGNAQPGTVLKPNPAPHGDKKKKGPKQLPAERPSTHGMTTRRQETLSTIQESAHATVAAVNQEATVENSRPVVPDYWEDSKLGDGWTTATHKKKRANPWSRPKLP
jgi:hypothetical protein